MSLIRTLYLIGILHASKYTLGQTIDEYVQASDMGWFEARKSCIEERDTDILVPSETGKLDPSHVSENTYYWIGGFETSEWQWTDNSPLFTNIGLCEVPTGIDNDDILDMPYNSVLECYRKCDKYTIGLIGPTCYCLDEIDQATCSEESGDMMCFGNPKDECGTESRMSVYKVDVPIKIDTDEDHQCAYSRIPYIVYKYIEVRTDDCNRELWSICDYDADKDFHECHNGLCARNEEATWTSSNQSCSLAKFSLSKEDDFIDLQYTYFRYWIGLHKKRFRHWIKDKTEQLIVGSTDSYPRCLALMKMDREWSDHWIPCKNKHQSICNTGGNSDTFDTTLATSSSTVLENENPGTTSLTEGHTSGNESGFEGNNNNGNIGIYVGVSVGCLLLFVIIGIAVMFKRKGKFCFKRKEGDKTIAMDNIAYISADNLQNRDVINGSGQRVIGNNATNQRRPGIDDNRCPSEENDDYDTAQAETKRPVNSGQPYDHLGAGDGYYDTAGVNGVNNVNDNTYDHTEAHGDPQRVMDYNSQDKRVVNVDNGPSQQNNDTYNHLSDSGTRKETLDSDKCYNHLVADVDHDYDIITRPVMDNVENDTYDHTGVYEVTDDAKKNMKDLRAQDSPDYYNL